MNLLVAKINKVLMNYIWQIFFLLFLQSAIGQENIALNKPVDASSTYNNEPLGLVTDGIIDGNYYNGNVTHTQFETNPWLRIDLEGYYLIKGLTIYNRTDCCSDRLAGVKVYISHLPNSQYRHVFTVQSNVNDVSNVYFKGHYGRYVKLVKEGSNKVLSVTEIKIIGDVSYKNVAIGKPTTQTSDYGENTSSSNAVDGNIYGDWGNDSTRSITQTGLETNAELVINLLKPHNISHIQVFNRTDCCQDRLNGVEVYLSDTNTITSKSILIGKINSDDLDDKLYSINKTGQFVILKKPEYGYLTVAEVAIFGEPLNKIIPYQAYQSSTYKDARASRIIDNNTDGNWNGNSVNHTQQNANNVVGVSLTDNSDIYHIKKIIIYNRTDNYSYRLNNVKLFAVSSKSSGNTETNNINSDNEIAVLNSDPVQVLDVDIFANRIYLHKEAIGPIHIAEIEFYGEPLSSENIALNKPTSQSSIAHGGHHSRAVDGNTNGVYGNGSVTHTDTETNPWLKIDLGHTYNIGRINVYNRTDCCTNRIDGANLYIGHDDSEDIKDYKYAGTITGSNYSHKVNTNLEGRYILLHSEGLKTLSVAEIKAYGHRVKRDLTDYEHPHIADVELPYPIYEFPLNYSDVEVWYEINSDGTKTPKQGQRYGSISSYINRFGFSGKAVKFNDAGNGVPASVIQSNIDPIPSDKPMTVSFWTYINNNQNLNPNSNPTFQTNKTRFFTLNTNLKSGGLSKDNNSPLIGVDQQISFNGNEKPWFVWLYEPTVLTKKGWYHIVMVCDPLYTKVHMFNPDGEYSCSYNYFHNQFDKKIQIGFSSKLANENVSGGAILDDFQIYDQVLDEKQVKLLNNKQTNNLSGEYYISLKDHTEKYLTVDSYNYNGDYAKIKTKLSNPTEDYKYRWNIEQSDNTFNIKQKNTELLLSRTSNALNNYIYTTSINNNYENDWNLKIENDIVDYDDNIRQIVVPGVNVEVATNYPSNDYLVTGDENNHVLWEFHKINNEDPGLEGVYTINNSPNKYIMSDINNQSETSISPYTGTIIEQYLFNFIKQKDNSYLIELDGKNQYLSTVNNKTYQSNIILKSKSESELKANWYSSYWVIEPLKNSNTEFYIRLSGTTNQYLRVKKGSQNKLYLDSYSSSINDQEDFIWHINKDLPSPTVLDKHFSYLVHGIKNNEQKYVDCINDNVSKGGTLGLDSEWDKLLSKTFSSLLRFIPNGDDTYRIKVTNTNLYLHVKDNYATTNQLIDLQPFDIKHYPYYTWKLEPVPSKPDTYYLNINQTLYYLSTYQDTWSNTSELALKQCFSNCSDRIEWNLLKITYDDYNIDGEYIINLEHKPSLSWQAFFYNNTSWLNTETTNSTNNNQIFKFEKQIDNTYRISVKNSPNKYLSTPNRTVSQNAHLEMNQLTDIDYDKYWFLDKKGISDPNVFRIRMVGSEKNYVFTNGFEEPGYRLTTIRKNPSSDTQDYNLKWKFNKIENGNNLNSLSRQTLKNSKSNNHKSVYNESILVLYPNPNSGNKLNIDYFSNSKFNGVLSFYDMKGSQIFLMHIKVENGVNNFVMDNLNHKGFNKKQMYILKFKSDDGSVKFSKKLLMK